MDSANQMDEEEYLSKRLDEQQRWYSKKSREAQSDYKFFKRMELVLSGCVTISACYASDVFVFPCGVTVKWGLLAAIGSAVITFLHCLEQLEKYHDNWIIYRKTSEALKREKVLYMTRAGVYAGNVDAFSLLVERCEDIMADENTEWKVINKQKVEVRQ